MKIDENGEVTFLMCSAQIPEVAPVEVTEAFFLRAKASRRTAASQLALHYNTEAAVNTTTVGVQHTTLSPSRGKMHFTPSNLKTHL